MSTQRLLFKKDLYIITLFFGFSSIIAQTIIIRELLTIFRGNEFIIGIIYSAWFLGIYLGARYNPETEVEKLKRRVTRSLLYFPIVLLAVVYLAHFIPIIFPKTTGTFYSIGAEFLFSIILTIPISISIGYFFPPVVSLVSREIKEKSGGEVYYIEAIGSFIGGILFSFILIDILNPLGIISILIFLSLSLYFKRYNNKIFYLFLLIPIVLFTLSDRIEKRIFECIWDRTHTGELSQYKRTRYQIISIESDNDQTRVYGDGIFYHSLPDRFETRSIFHLIQSIRHKVNEKLLVLGTGSGSLIYNLLRADISALYYFEIDKELWRLENQYRKLYYKEGEKEKRLKIIPEDIRHFLFNTDEKFDMIICLPPPPENAMLNRFYTRDFYSLCKDRLKSDGVFLTYIHGFSNYMGIELKRYIGSIYKGFKEEFPEHLHSSGETIYLVGAARVGIIPNDYNILIESYKKRFSSLLSKNIEKEILENFDPEELRMLFEKTQIEYFEKQMGALLPDVQENLDLKPKTYWNKTVLSAFEEKSILYRLLRSYISLPALMALLTIFILINLRKRYGKKQSAAGFIIFVTGFVSISSVILLITLYQNFYGIIYYRISLMNALFMLGLATGGYISNRFEIRSLIKNFLLLILTLTLFLLILYTHIKIDYPFWIIIFIFSLQCGIIFPSLFLSISKGSYHTTASILDSMDHFGSIIGALLTSIFLIPILGITSTVVFNIILLFITIIVVRYYRNLL